MASRKRFRIRPLTGAILAALLGVGSYELWTHTAMRDHPWPLELQVDRLVADCRIGPGAFVFQQDLQLLGNLVAEAKQCLAMTGSDWALQRDYTGCAQKLLNVSLTAYRIRLSQTIRFQNEKDRLGAALKTLEFELGIGSRSQPEGNRIGIPNQDQSRARTLLATAQNLAALGQFSSALTAALSARAAWTQSENLVDAELARFDDPQLRARWEKQARDLLRWTRETGRSAVLVDKFNHRCLWLVEGRIGKSYAADLSRNWYRIKVRESDASMPEGEYKVRQKIPGSSFGAALLLDYPNAADWQRFNALKRAGTIESRGRIGSAIEIHGGGRSTDWTDGCVALFNAEMQDLFKRAYVGMPVTIVGICSLGASRQ
jgi:hypothetical protein